MTIIATQRHFHGAHLTLADGSLWFQPFDGRAPTMIRGPFNHRSTHHG